MNISAILFLLSKQYKCICINIDSFTEILRDGAHNHELLKLDPITSRDILKTGLYAMIGDPPVKLFVSNILVGEGKFRTSNIDVVNVRRALNNKEWSSEISFDVFIKENAHKMILV